MKPVLSKCLLFLFLLTGCEKYYLTVKHEHVDRDSLASTFVQSPDPRQENPPRGQKLFLEWYLPNDAINKKLLINLQILFRDYTEKTLYFPVTKKRGIEVISFLDEEYFRTGGFLTYKAEIFDLDGNILQKWQQQLWVDLIEID